MSKEKSVPVFKLEADEMSLAVAALASSEEYQLYRKVEIGQKIAGIIDGYQKIIGKSETAQTQPPETAETATPPPTKEEDDNGLPKK